jgi:hypothetical protein
MDIDYMRKNLNVLVRDIHSYTDAEMARALLRLANVSCADTVRQQLTKPADEVLIEALRKINSMSDIASVMSAKHIAHQALSSYKPTDE